MHTRERERRGHLGLEQVNFGINLYRLIWNDASANPLDYYRTLLSRDGVGVGVGVR